MNRNEIAEVLRNLILEGRLKSKASLGISYGAINKMIAKKELYPTSFAPIVCTDEGARNVFEKFVWQKRVMDGTTVKVEKNLLTLYAINMECATGRLLRFPELGNSCILYID